MEISMNFHEHVNSKKTIFNGKATVYRIYSNKRFEIPCYMLYSPKQPKQSIYTWDARRKQPFTSGSPGVNPIFLTAIAEGGP